MSVFRLGALNPCVGVIINFPRCLFSSWDQILNSPPGRDTATMQPRCPYGGVILVTSHYDDNKYTKQSRGLRLRDSWNQQQGMNTNVVFSLLCFVAPTFFSRPGNTETENVWRKVRIFSSKKIRSPPVNLGIVGLF